MKNHKNKAGKKINVLLMTGYHDTAIMYSVVSPPIGLYRLQHYLNSRDINCDVLDLGLNAPDINEGNTENVDTNFGRFAKLIDKGKYDIIGVSVDQENMSYNLNILWNIRLKLNKLNKKCLLISGGQAATHNYKQWIIEGALDAVLLGFSEKTLYALCKNFKNDRELHIEDLSKNINGIAYQNKKGIFHRKPAPVLSEEEFRELNYDAVLKMDIPYNEYWNNGEVKKAGDVLNLNKSEESVDVQKFFIETVRLYTSSHCSWKCGFCNSQSFLKASQDFQNPVHRLSPEEIHDLIIYHVNKYNPRVFLFNDDAFMDGSHRGQEHIMNLCQLIIESKNQGKISNDTIFNCQTRVNDFIQKSPVRKVNMDLLELLKKAGFYHFGMGVETFANRLYSTDSLNKRATTAEDTEMVLTEQLAAKMSPSINIILFVPETTVEELFYVMKITTNWIIKGCQIAMTPLLRPNPGTSLYDKIISGKSDIEIVYSSWKNPHNQRTVEYPVFCKPKDKRLAEMIDRFEIKEFQDMARLSKPVYDRILKKHNWGSNIIPRPIQALAVFITVSNLLENEVMAKYFERVASGVLKRNMYSDTESEHLNNDLITKESLVL